MVLSDGVPAFLALLGDSSVLEMDGIGGKLFLRCARGGADGPMLMRKVAVDAVSVVLLRMGWFCLVGELVSL